MQIVEREGEAVLEEIDDLLPQLLLAEVSLTKARTKIGILINEVRDKQYWRLKGHESFGDYINQLEKDFNRGRTQLYAYASLCRDLLPEVGEEKLTAMGLEKAKLLCQAKKSTGSLPGVEIIDMAADDGVSTKDFRQALLAAKKIPDVPQDGKYYSIEYFASKSRHETIQAGMLSVKRTENISGQDEMVNGQVLELMAAECLGTLGGEL